MGKGKEASLVNGLGHWFFRHKRIHLRWIRFHPVVALKTNAISSKTLLFVSFESMDQLIKDFTFNEVQSHHEIRPLCLTEQGFAVIQHGYFCNNGVHFTPLPYPNGLPNPGLNLTHFHFPQGSLRHETPFLEISSRIF